MEYTEPTLQKPEMPKTHKPYTMEDQEFFFRIANEITDHFNELADVPSENLYDAILFFTDLMVADIERNLEIFNSWKSAQKNLEKAGAGLVWNSGTYSTFGKDPFPRPV